MFDLILIAACLTVLGIAGYRDFRSHRIPNRVVLWGLLLAFLLNVTADKGIGFTMSLAGFGLGLAITLPIYVLRALGAGDVKLISVVGAFLGPQQLLGALLVIVLTGGVLAIAVALRLGVLRRVFENIRFLVFGVAIKAANGSLPAVDSLPAPAARMPYGVAIAIGTLAYLVWKYVSRGQS